MSPLSHPLRALSATAVVVGALSITGCGSSSTATSTPTTTAPSTATSTSGAGGSIDGSPVPTAVPGRVGGLPSVAHATDLQVEPTVSAGGDRPPATLLTRDLVVGKGATPSSSSTVTVQYVGALYTTGRVFDASWTDSGPASFSLQQVVPGFAQAIEGMKVGGRREVVIPPSLGYGDQASGPIPANSTLVFVIDLLAVKG